MKLINLKKYYPYYSKDVFVEVPDEIVDVFESFIKSEISYERKKYRYKANYSLDCNDGIENSSLLKPLSPAEIYELKFTSEQLCAAIASLPNKQAKRIYAHYFIGMSMSEIARAEGVNKSQISRSIKKALSRMKVFLEKKY
ncbi:sigma-70 family RNA polymerase sigma factor [Clostridium cadaveris]|uniref:sigma-70 family RNA polymerase sigma factor n=1 Tax=Clostridium cadaveris TaxID=1529 RepID=UPI0015B52E00|nr:sigma-70 family RNA polymerase sigma factor [Clostridium cadaveris]NWK11957.1 sigma-70 family RNA polymerase sigma factor [Clostridium cadaveris]